MDRGVTMLSGETGYLKKQTQMIFSVISNREVPKIEKLILCQYKIAEKLFKKSKGDRINKGTHNRCKGNFTSHNLPADKKHGHIKYKYKRSYRHSKGTV